MSYSQLLKKLFTPFVNPAIRILQLRLFGRNIFINLYTKRIPLLGKFVKKVQTRASFSETHHIREIEYERWLKKNYPNETLTRQQLHNQFNFKNRPLISIVLPTYNTIPTLLEECLNSVINQTYDNWELCIADDASTDKNVRDIIIEYAKKDKRIKYVFRRKNGHICRASNSALKLATGKFVALLDHDDVLWPNALYEVVKKINEKPSVKFIYSDEDKIDADGEKHSEPFFKPDWSFDFLRSANYITHFTVIEKKLLDKVGNFRPGYEGAQDWDLFLRLSRETNDIVHIPMVIYSWRKIKTSTALKSSAKNYAFTSQKKALLDDIKARGLKAEVSWQIPFLMWRVDYEVIKQPLVSIIIPTKNQRKILEKCLSSIKKKTFYKNFEIILVDTGSNDKKVWRLYNKYSQLLNLKVVKWNKAFSFSSACNIGADQSKGEYLLFLNNDTEVISPHWIDNMLGYAQQKGIGAVGCKLYYPDGKLQHGGVILGAGGDENTPGIAAHFFPAYKEKPPQDPGQLLYDGGTRNFAAVTAACLMVDKEKFKSVGGFDPKFRIAFNDVDFCLKLLKAGYRNVLLPHVQMFHYESISIGKPGKPGMQVRDLAVFSKEIELMRKKWGDLIANDPFYHPEFQRDGVASARLKQ